MQMNKQVRLGSYKSGARTYPIHCQIKIDGERLSITGVMGAKSNGDAEGSCGQIGETLRAMIFNNEIEFAPGWDLELAHQFLNAWEGWHLNDMRAGTPEQRAELQKHTFPGYPASHYEWASDVLEKAGLNPHNGYKYGSAWLKDPLPEIVRQTLAALPDADIPCKWNEA